jgi:adenine-specific DNA-methyltransferase
MSDQNTDDIQHVPSTTPDFQTELARKLQELAPEAVSDGKIDTQKLKELLDKDSADDSERFGLFWPGKKRAMRSAQEPTTATLKPAKDISKDWDTTENIFIEGDNLETLKILQKYYHNKIKMIYIDPPYNTGKDFVYPDNYKEGLASYLDFTKQVDEEGRKVSTNSDTDGRYHSNWLSMMYPRTKLARNLLTDDGLIFVSIDNHEEDNLKKVLNEVFGENNFVNKFTWVNNLKGRQISGHGAAGTHETVFCYARNIENVSEFKDSAQLLKSLMPSTYKGFNYDIKEDASSQYVIKNELFNSNSVFNEETRPNLVYDIYYNPKTGEVKTADISEEHVYADFVKIAPKQNNNGSHKYHAYRWSRKKVAAEYKDLEFVEKDGSYKIYTKIRDFDKTIAKDIITDINTTQGTADIDAIGIDSRLFDYPKPVGLIKFLVAIATDDDSIVLDFFSGSGTTAHAVYALNAQDGGQRVSIQVQLPEPTDPSSKAYKSGYKTISSISVDRIKKAGEYYETKRERKDSPFDAGVRVFKLSDSNFTKWRSDSNVDKDALQQHLLDIRESSNDAASEEELLVEVLLKQGISLTAKITHEDVSGLSVWNVGETTVLAYLNEHTKPNLDQLRDIVSKEPAKFIILEDAFHGDDELKTNLAQICKTNKIELWTV